MRESFWSTWMVELSVGVSIDLKAYTFHLYLRVYVPRPITSRLTRRGSLSAWDSDEVNNFN